MKFPCSTACTGFFPRFSAFRATGQSKFRSITGRTRGKSKYGVGNRMWRGMVDCLAMRWFHTRSVRGDRAQGE